LARLLGFPEKRTGSPHPQSTNSLVAAYSIPHCLGVCDETVTDEPVEDFGTTNPAVTEMAQDPTKSRTSADDFVMLLLFYQNEMTV